MILNQGKENTIKILKDQFYLDVASRAIPYQGRLGVNNKASPPGRHQEQAPKQRCTFRPTTFSSVQFTGLVDQLSRRGAAELIIKPCPLAARICCTFSPTTFSSVQYQASAWLIQVRAYAMPSVPVPPISIILSTRHPQPPAIPHLPGQTVPRGGGGSGEILLILNINITPVPPNF